MGLFFRLLSLVGSARNARETIATARGSIDQIKARAEGFQTASFQRTFERANAGDPAAQYDLGEYHYDGRAVPQDYTEAFGWFLKAAEQGHGKSQLNVGLMLFLGRGTPKDQSAACQWLGRASEQAVEGAEEALEKARRKMQG